MDANAVKQIVSALGLIHNPESTNEARLEAQMFLNQVEDEDESPYWGYQLALPENNTDPKTSTIVRHYGLLLLQRSVSNKYDQFDAQKELAVREYVVELAKKAQLNDPTYIKEKLASIWVDIAKLCWGSYLEGLEDNDSGTHNPTDQQRLLGWQSMDADMLSLWEGNLVKKELSLIIFRTLFEDIYILDDIVATKRSHTLSMLCTEITVPASVMEKLYTRDILATQSRANDEGWVTRWTSLLRHCLEDRCESPESRNFAIRVLQTLKTCFHWVITDVLVDNEVLSLISSCLIVSSVRVKILAIDCLHVLLNRHYQRKEDFLELVAPVFRKEAIAMFQNVYRNTRLNPDDVDAEEYSLLKKLVELTVCFSHHLSTASLFLGPKPLAHPHTLPEDSDILGYLQFVLETTYSDSLIISGLSTNFWITVLRTDAFAAVYPEFNEILPSLLEVAAAKFIPYELFDDDHVAKKFLTVDFDSQPDSLAYIGNYKKSLEDIIRITTCRIPLETVAWLEDRLGQFFASDMGNEVLTKQRFDLTTNSDSAQAFFLAISQLLIVGAVVKGISRWKIWYTELDKEVQEKKITDIVEVLFVSLLQVKFLHPILTKVQMQVLTHFTPSIKNNAQLVFNLLERIMFLFVEEPPHNIGEEEASQYNELKTALGNELSRIGMNAPESLARRYSELEAVVNDLLKNNDLSKHDEVSLKCFLLVVAFKGLPIEQRPEKFELIVDSDLNAWDDPQTVQGLNNLHWFMERLGVVEIASYFSNRGITADTDLFKTEMDEEGRELRKKLKKRWDVVFPTRSTRFYFSYSFEKVEPDTEEYFTVYNLWEPRMKRILPNVLKLISQIQAYQNPNNWTDLPIEVQSFLKQSCTERFWHHGLSIKSKDEYVEEHVQATKTLRDFADLLGHKIRYIREYAFYIIDEATTLGPSIYQIPNLPNMLWSALAGSTVGITPHSWKHMLNSCYKAVLHNCPDECLESFLHEFLSLSLGVIDDYIVAQWEVIMRNGIQMSNFNATDDELSDEMMFEHTIRQITVLCSRMMIELVGQVTAKEQLILNSKQKSRRKLILANGELLEKVIKMVYHILRFKDSRCCYNMVLIFRGLMSEIINKNETIDQWLCQEVLPILVKFVNDSYYHEMAGDIVSLINEIYFPLRKKYEEPKLVLQEACQSNERAINHLEVILDKLKTPKQQRNFMHQFIISKQNDSFIKEQRKKAILKKKKTQETDLMSKSLTDNPAEVGVLANLFG